MKRRRIILANLSLRSVQVAIGNFMLSVFIIIRVYVFGVPEYRVFVF